MTARTTRSIQNIEERMLGLDPGSFRYQVLESAKRFKSSWIELGQSLFSVYKDKLFKDWGYLTFEAYCAKEIGIRQNTAMKLLKSYSFLEREEPTFLKREEAEDRKPRQIPSFESVNTLRLAKANDRVSEGEYKNLREEVFDRGTEDVQVKKKLRYILQSHPKKLTEEDVEARKVRVIRRVVQNLKTAKNDLAEFSFPNKVLKEIDALVDLLEEFQT